MNTTTNTAAAQTYRACGWYIAFGNGCYATFDSLEIAEAVAAEQPQLEGIEEGFWNIRKVADDEYDVKVYYPNLQRYISPQAWASIS